MLEAKIAELLAPGNPGAERRLHRRRAWDVLTTGDGQPWNSEKKRLESKKPSFG